MIRSSDPARQNSDWPTDVPGQVSRILVDLFELDQDAVTPDARLREDLKLDSLDGVDLVVALEKHFKCLVEEDTVKKLRTVGEIHAYVVARLASRSS